MVIDDSMDLRQLCDSHCHLSVQATNTSVNELVDVLNEETDLPNRFFHLMSTNHIDIDFIDTIVHRLQKPLVHPYFGIHPWYSHLYTDLDNSDDQTLKKEHYNSVLVPPPSLELLEILPVPISLTEHLNKLEALCMKHNGSVGEIGLDRLFRIPSNGFFGNQDLQEGVKLTDSKVKLEHQIMVFKRQLELAKKWNRQVSVHCVKAHGPLYDIIRDSNVPHVILHSFTGSVDQAKMWVKKYKAPLSFSFSNYINGEKSEQLKQLLEVIPDDQILVETDLGVDNCFQTSYKDHLISIATLIRDLRNWSSSRFYKTIQSNTSKHFP